jgi:hypothetical protein
MRELLTLDSSSRDLCRRGHSEGLVSQVGLRTRSDAEHLWQSREPRSTVAGILPPRFLVTLSFVPIDFLGSPQDATALSDPTHIAITAKLSGDSEKCVWVNNIEAAYPAVSS